MCGLSARVFISKLNDERKRRKESSPRSWIRIGCFFVAVPADRVAGTNFVGVRKRHCAGAAGQPVSAQISHKMRRSGDPTMEASLNAILKTQRSCHAISFRSAWQLRFVYKILHLTMYVFSDSCYIFI